MSLLRDDEVERALVIVAYPDDAEFWAGATVALWVADGVEVSYLVLTDGDAGGVDPGPVRQARCR
ncbi:MAG: PIG-L deacetylase family protein [Pseudonocardiaceae bacterium]